MSSTARPIPVWVQLCAFFGVMAIMCSLVAFTMIRANRAEQKTQAAKENRARAKEEKDFQEQELIFMRRNLAVARCRANDDLPALFIDKVVCLRREAVAWEKYDNELEYEE